MVFWHVKMLNVVFYHMNVIFMDLTTLVLIFTMFENWKVFVLNLSQFPSHVATRENIEGPKASPTPTWRPCRDYEDNSMAMGGSPVTATYNGFFGP